MAAMLYVSWSDATKVGRTGIGNGTSMEEMIVDSEVVLRAGLSAEVKVD